MMGNSFVLYLCYITICNSLLPMLKESWEEFGTTLEIGKAVKVEVVKVNYLLMFISSEF